MITYPPHVKTIGQKVRFCSDAMDGIEFQCDGHMREPSQELDAFNRYRDERDMWLNSLQDKVLDYGQCPSCGDMCQPPDSPEMINPDYFSEYCYCCDCKLQWNILIPKEAIAEESHLRGYMVSDVCEFDIIVPYGCKE